jgi:hypothetical protein
MARKSSLTPPVSPLADLNTVADNTPTRDDQAGRCLLLVRSVGDPTGHLVEGIACLQDWQSFSD